MINIINMYFNYNIISRTIQVYEVRYMLIGICGKSGSGKNTLASKLMDLYKTAIHCDIDKIGHKALLDETVKKELINCFGEEIITGNKVDRKKLGNIVFASPREMDKLTNVTWSYMQKEIDNIIMSNNDKVIILDWVLLPKSKYFNKCKLKILLDIPYEIRKERALIRDNIDEKAFKLRDDSSAPFNADDFNLVIKDNNQINLERIVSLL